MEKENIKTEKKDLNAPDHLKELGRLNRITGQLEGIKKMIAKQRDCSEILSQLRAVRSAVWAVEANILKEQLKFCVEQSFNSPQERQQRIDELRDLFDRFHEI